MHFTRLFNDNPSLFNRVEGILQSVNHFFPEIIISFPSEKGIRYGYRSCFADGLRFISKPAKWSNLVVTTGHAMVGLSPVVGSRKLLSEWVKEQPTCINLSPFDSDRFSLETILDSVCKILAERS